MSRFTARSLLGFLTLYFVVATLLTTRAAETLVVRKPQVIDLRNISMVVFDLGAPGTISSFENVTPGSLYVFYFNNDNTTLTDQNAFFSNGNSKVNFKANTSVLFVGESRASVRQVADGVTSR